MIKLYTAPTCPFAHRARLAISEKGVEHERVQIDLKAMPDWFRKLSPNESVPLLVHDEEKVWESLIVMEYLDEAFEGPALMPKSALERARVRLAIEAIGSKMMGPFFKAMTGKLDDAQFAMDELWQTLVGSMATDGPYWCGWQLTLADLAAYPWFERAPVMEKMSNVKLKYPPRLQAWVDAVAARPAVEKERGNVDTYTEAFKALAAR
jgi:glutathione S-transferase